MQAAMPDLLAVPSPAAGYGCERCRGGGVAATAARVIGAGRRHSRVLGAAASMRQSRVGWLAIKSTMKA